MTASIHAGQRWSTLACRNLLWLLLFLFAASAGTLPLTAAAAETSSVPSQTKSRYGVVWKLTGEVFIVDAGGRTRSLKSDDIVFVGERINTGFRGEVAILTDDAGLIAIRPRSDFVAEAFEARGRSSDRIALRLIKGSLRLVSGWVSRLNRDAYNVYTPTASIGIRGTDHEPFVLTAETAESTSFQSGSYDKVNRGLTALITDAGQVEIPAGRVGFARQPGSDAQTNRGLMTLLLPVLLDRVPDFYTGGSFEADLDEYSRKADALAQQRLDELRKTTAAEAGECEGESAAKEWIARFDAAVQKRDADAVLSLFSDKIIIEASVRNTDGSFATTRFGREDFAASVRRAVGGLENYDQRRMTFSTQPMPRTEGQDCAPVRISSRVVEQGLLSGRPYRVESDEEYILELLSGKWLATTSRTTQR